jgi:hypothetical protein
MANRKTLDVFITHAWRYHEDWTRLCEMLTSASGAFIRNFSVPWHDPALDPNTPLGSRLIRENLEAQIAPVDGVLLLAGVYAVKSAQRWLDLELEIARRERKGIIALPPIGEEKVPEAIAQLADEVAPWNGSELLAVLERLAAARSH